MDPKQILLIQTDQEGAELLKQEVAKIDDARIQARQVQGQGGAPDVWSVMAEVTIKTIGILVAPLMTVLGKGKAEIVIDHPKIGKITCRTVEEFERIVRQLKKVS